MDFNQSLMKQFVQTTWIRVSKIYLDICTGFVNIISWDSKLVTPAHGSNFQNPKQNANADMLQCREEHCENVNIGNFQWHSTVLQQTASQQWQEASFTEKPLCDWNFTRLEAEVMSKNHLIQTHNPFILYSIIMALVEIKKPMFID